VNVPKSLPDTLVLTIWADNNAGLNTTGAKVTTTVLNTNKDRLKGDLIIQKPTEYQTLNQRIHTMLDSEVVVFVLHFVPHTVMVA
jgi:hypothetical protein